jgi:two-component system, chemotaxis family, chemotaxis protein CheY
MLEQARVLEADDAGLVAANAGPPAPRLLVIDDDHLHCTIICRVATRAGFAPVGAATYEAAAKLVQETTFDCITLDLSLGAHAGVEMLRHLWVLGCKTPIIIISGCDDAKCRETVRIGKSLNLKIQEPVPKPVDLAMLRYSFERLRAQVQPRAA